MPPQMPQSTELAAPLATAADAPVAASPLLRAGLDRWPWLAAAVLCAAYAAWLGQLGSFPLQDYPNHVARGTVLADLLFHGGARFGQIFDFHFALVPYLAHDLLLASLIELFGPSIGAGIFSALVLLSLPAALLFYLRVAQVPRDARVVVLLVSLYLATDFFYLMAFMAFRLAIALIVVYLALLESLRRHWSEGLYLAYVLLLVLGWLVHLTALVFFLPLLLASALVRLAAGHTTLARELRLLAPVLALLGLNALVMQHWRSTAPPAYAYNWGVPSQKLSDLRYAYERFDGRPAVPLMLMFVFCVAWPVLRFGRRGLNRATVLRPEVLELLLGALAFLGAYCVLPETYSDSSFVDVRALPMVLLCLLLASTRLAARVPAVRAGPGLLLPAVAALLALANLGYLVLHLGKDERFLEGYRATLAAIPTGSRVLPVHTRIKQMYLSPFLHAGSFAVIDRGAITPYLFSGDRGEPMKYFRYRHRPYMPDESWYLARVSWNKATPRSFQVQGQWYRWRFDRDPGDYYWHMLDAVPVEWNRVACEFDYVLVTQPFRRGLIEVPGRLVAANGSAGLIAIDHGACSPQRTPPSPVHLPGEH